MLAFKKKGFLFYFCTFAFVLPVPIVPSKQPEGGFACSTFACCLWLVYLLVYAVLAIVLLVAVGWSCLH
jgi:hypothetical protein